MVRFAGKMRDALKKIASAVAICLTVPLYIVLELVSLMWKRDAIFWGISQSISLLPGQIGTYLRNAFYTLSMKQFGKGSMALFGTIFAQRDTEVGEDVYIGPNCNIGLCRIADNCILGSNVHILSGRHQHIAADTTLNIKDQGGRFEQISIGEDTWIGNCAIIMANVGKKCIIGAGSVVVKDVDDYSVVAGNPAKVIRQRT